jgi:hypothetical protein
MFNRASNITVVLGTGEEKFFRNSTLTEEGDYLVVKSEGIQRFKKRGELIESVTFKRPTQREELAEAKTHSRYKISKLEDRADAEHPNHIPVGLVRTGLLIRDVIIGERCNLYPYAFNDRGISTSVVQEILESGLNEEGLKVVKFKTYNSIYTLEELK